MNVDSRDPRPTLGNDSKFAQPFDQVLIAWGLQRGTAVIPKSSNPERIRQNRAAADVTPGADELALLNGLERAERYVTGEFWCPEGSPYSLEGLWV